VTLPLEVGIFATEPELGLAALAPGLALDACLWAELGFLAWRRRGDAAVAPLAAAAPPDAAPPDAAPPGWARELVARAPLGLLAAAGGVAPRWAGCFRVLRLLHLPAALSWLRAAETDLRVDYLSLRIGRMCAGLVLAAHGFACGFFGAAWATAGGGDSWTAQVDGAPPSTKYVFALYWVLSCVLGLPNETVPGNPAEYAVACLASLGFFAAMVYITAHATSLIVQVDAAQVHFREQAARLRDLGARRGLPDALREQMEQQEKLAYATELADEALLERLPAYLRAEVRRHMYHELLLAAPPFAGARRAGGHRAYVGAVAEAARPEVVAARAPLFRRSTAVQHLYLLVEGGMLRTDAHGRTTEVGPGAVLAAAEFFMQTTHACDVRAQVDSLVLAVPRERYAEVARAFPPEHRATEQAARQAWLQASDTLPEDAQHADSVGAQARSRMNMELCYASLRGDCVEIREMLGEGYEVNGRDYDLRTALHVAASVGHAGVCGLLMEALADPTARDRFGNTPLAEALRHRQAGALAAIVARTSDTGELDTVTMLCRAAARNDVEGLALMVQSGVDLDAADYDHRTAAHVAASEGQREALALLAAAGANLELVDRWGQRPEGA
jgi:hypothetical protein